MRYLLDTNIVSELRKGTRCDPAVAAWEQTELIPHGGAISVITIGEIRKGIDLLAQRDPQQAARWSLGWQACVGISRAGFFLFRETWPRNGGV